MSDVERDALDVMQRQQSQTRRNGATSMKLIIEKTESGSYTVTDHNDTVSYGYAETGVMSSVLFFMAQDLPLPKEPAIPACLHCGSSDAPLFRFRTKLGGADVGVQCTPDKDGCGSSSGWCNTKEEAIALWSGVKDDWIEHSGNECPVDSYVKVEVRFKDRARGGRGAAGGYRWSHIGNPGDITHYRIHKG